MENTEQPDKGLFAKLDGTPAHVLIIAGLALTLFAPLIPNFKLAGVASARMDAEQADALIELDLADLKRDQDRERKEELRQAQANEISFVGLTPEELQKRQEEARKREADRQKREEARQKALEQKQDDLKKKYDNVVLKRAVLRAQNSAAGMHWHLVLAWLGRLALLAGLLVLTIQSEGVRQKVLLVVLLVVMFSSLSGVNVDFLARGNLGESPQEQRR